MNTVANISYLQDRRKAGFKPDSLSSANTKAWDMLAELTEGFTDMDMVTADESFEKSLDLLVAAMKASSGPKKEESAPKSDKRTDAPIQPKPAKYKEGVQVYWSRTKDPKTVFTIDRVVDAYDDEEQEYVIVDKSMRVPIGTYALEKHLTPVPAKKQLNDKQKKQAATVRAKATGVKTVKKSRDSDGVDFAERMRKARAAKQAATKTEQSSETAAAAAPGAKTKSAKKASTRKESSVKPPKPAKEKKPTKAQVDLETYEAANKVRATSEEVKHIKRFISLVKKTGTAEDRKAKLLNAVSSLQKAITTRKITKASTMADEIVAIQAAYLKAAKAAPFVPEVSEEQLAHLVSAVGGERVYKSVEIIGKWVNWAGRERTGDQIKKFLTEVENAKKKIYPEDPYANRVDDIRNLLRQERNMKVHTFRPEQYGLSGLAGMLGCGCQHKPERDAGQSISGTPAKAVTKKPARGGKKSTRRATLAGVPDAPTALSVVNEPVGKVTASPIPVLPVTSGLVTKPRWPAVMSAHELTAIDYPTYDFKDDPATNDWATLFGKPQRPFSAMFSGAPGAGKSTLLMQLAVYLAKNFGPTRYVSSEEYPSLTLADKLERAGGAVKDLSFSKDLNDLGKDVKFVIIDSTTHIKITLPQFLQLKKQMPDTSFILILQYTKSGLFKGNNEWPHEVDAVFFIDAGVVQTTKNRFVREPGTIQVFKD